jgi:hypothetical protein
VFTLLPDAKSKIENQKSDDSRARVEPRPPVFAPPPNANPQSKVALKFLLE